LRAERRALTNVERKRAARAAARQLAATRLFRACRRIACYLPNDGEIDPSSVIERIWSMGKTAYLPVLARDRLWFAPAPPGMQLKPNRFGIPEPVVTRSRLVRANRLDLILLPLVAFDLHGNRLGMGGGFYDKSLEFRRGRSGFRAPHLLGLAYDFQKIERLPINDWDVPLDGFVTDRAVYMIQPDDKNTKGTFE